MEDNKIIYFATKALIINKDKFLIMHKSNIKENIWELPGGRMEFGESAEETLKREVLEETGLFVYQEKILDTWDYIGKDYQITGIIYLCKVDKIDIKLSDEHDEYKWVDLNKESISYMHEVYKVRMKNWELLKFN